MLYFGAEYIHGFCVHIVLFQYGLNDMNWYFGIVIVIGMFEVQLEMVFVICV